VSFYKQSIFLKPVEIQKNILGNGLSRAIYMIPIDPQYGDMISLMSLGGKMIDSSAITKCTLYIGGHAISSLSGWDLEKFIYDDYPLHFIDGPIYNLLIKSDTIVVELEYDSAIFAPENSTIKVQYRKMIPTARQNLLRDERLSTLQCIKVKSVGGNHLIMIYQRGKLYWKFDNRDQEYDTKMQYKTCGIYTPNYMYNIILPDPTESWYELNGSQSLPQPY
jgi:hypothetical protein